MEELKRKLLQVVNESNLPLEAIYYLVKDLYRDVDDTYQHYLREAQKQQEEQKEEE